MDASANTYPAAFTPAMRAYADRHPGLEVLAWHAAGAYVLAAVTVPGGYGVFLLNQDGDTYRAPKAHDAMALAKLIAGWEDDAALSPQLVGIIGARPLDDLNDGPGLATPHSVEVGQVVWTQGTGRLRRGVVTAVGRTRVEVAYTTASSAGRVYRTRLPLASLRIDSEAPRTPAPAAQLEAHDLYDDNTGQLLGTYVEAPHLCEPCHRGGRDVEAVDLIDRGGDTWEAVCAAHRNAHTDLAGPGLDPAPKGTWVSWDAKPLICAAGTGVVVSDPDRNGYVSVRFHDLDYRGWPTVSSRIFNLRELRPAVCPCESFDWSADPFGRNFPGHLPACPDRPAAPTAADRARLNGWGL